MVQLTKKEQRKVLGIAKKFIYGVKERGDLEQRFRDSDDFLDVAVWSLREALEEAYTLSKKEAQNAKEG